MTYSPLKIPISQEGLITTLNNMGYMTEELDEYSQYFVDHCSSLTGPLLDIGAAYGNATLAALNKGAHMIANDLDSRHLSILKSRANPKALKRLQLLQGRFPSELNFSENSLEGILISQVLHFFMGEEIFEAVKKIFYWLKPKAKVVVVVGTPYIGIYRDFIPIFEQRKKLSFQWPGLIEDISKYQHHRTQDLPRSMLFFDNETLECLFKDEGFIIEKSSMFSRKKIPKDLKWDGRESAGLIAIKP